MERRKNEIHTNFNRLKEECGSLVSLLNSLLDRHMKSVKIIENMRHEDILKNSSYFINVSRGQYEAIQQILTINLDLESFLAKELVPQPAADMVSTFTPNTDESDTSSNESVNQNTVIIQHAPVVSTPNDSSGETCITPSNKDISYISSIKPKEIPKDESFIGSINPEDAQKSHEGKDISHFSLINPKNLQKSHGGKDISYISSIKTKDTQGGKDISYISSIKPKEIPKDKSFISSIKPENSSRGKAVSSIKSEGRKDIPNISFIKVKGAEKADGVGDQYMQTDDDRSMSESSETVTEKLSKRKCMSRQQRYIKDLKKPVMPDLSFKVAPAGGSSTEFCSATEGDTESDVAYQESYNHSVIRTSEPPELGDRCVVSYLVSPSEFYINKMDDDDGHFEKMVKRLERLGNYFSKFSSKSEAKRNINKYCMAFSTVWESWNRAEVVDWHLNATPQTAHVEVQYVDYGDYEVVPYNNLRVLPHELCEKPRLAIKCHLAYLFPPNSSPGNCSQKWPESSIDAVRELMGSPDSLYEVLFVEKFADSFGVDLIRAGELTEEDTIGQQLIDLKKAVEIVEQFPTITNSFMKEQLRTAQGMSGVTSGMNMDEIMHQFCENVDVAESDKLEEAITGYAAQDEARICRFARNGSCYKGAKCNLDHDTLNKDGFTKDKLLIFTDALATLPSPQIGQDLKIIITSVCSVNKFYGQVRSYDIKGESLKNLINSLNSPNVKHPPLKILPASGEIVIAKYCDNKWYRARVCDITSNSEVSDVVVKVFFVDYGDVADVQFKDLRQISQKYLHLPFQAVRFHIDNIIPKKGSDLDKGVEYFEQVYLFKNFTANVMYVAAGFVEVLVTNRDDQDIGMHLIEVGYAESKILNLLPLDNGNFLVD